MEATAGVSAGRQPNLFDAVSSQPTLEASRVVSSISRPGSGNIPYSYLHLLSRISHYSQQASDTFTSWTEGPTYTGVINLLLQQPPEIRMAILDKLVPRDLLRLRATSHTLHNLVHESSSALCGGLTKRVFRGNDLFHIRLNIPDLSAFVKISTRYRSACEVAVIIAKRITPHVSPTCLSLDERALDAWRKKKSRILERRLRRNLVVLELYLMFVLHNINANESTFEPLENDEYTSVHNIFLFDEQEYFRRHMSGLTEADVVEVTTALDVLGSTCKARYVPFSKKSPAYPFVSVKQILVYKGLAPFAELLAEDAGLALQETVLRRQSKSFSQHRRSSTLLENHNPCPALSALEGYWHHQKVRFDANRSSSARALFISQQDIWVNSSRAFMQHKLGRPLEKQTASAWIRGVCIEDEKSMSESAIYVGDWDKPVPR